MEFNRQFCNTSLVVRYRENCGRILATQKLRDYDEDTAAAGKEALRIEVEGENGTTEADGRRVA
jgi:hypothetical protein